MHRIHCCIIPTTFIPTHMHTRTLFLVTALVPTIDPPSAVVRNVEQVVARRRSLEIEAVLPLPQTAAHRAGEAAKYQADGGGWDVMGEWR